jgi:choline dehydrogenase
MGTVTYVDNKFERVSSETAYLTKDVLARPNLTVAINAQVTRVLFETQDGLPHAVGVEFSRTEGGIRRRAKAKKEVIMTYAFFNIVPCLILVLIMGAGLGPSTPLM